ncbi:MAG: NTP transferase domain-containing protein, partial [Candidatus Eremiobacteraeota bacterium]|nr:NTP transferase domain-containing protein [Candidatus Eremiobacteraeota bacterium]
MSDRVYAAITAGGRVDGKFAERLGTRVKALAPIGPQSLLEIAIEALKGAGVEGIAVVGGAEVRAVCHTLVDRIIDESQDGVENMRRALNAWGGERTLYMTSDLPFVCASEILSFQQFSRPEAITMPVADEETYERVFPGAPPHITALGPERVAG